MAKVLITKKTLQDIANSIRSKTGSQETMSPSQMPGEIDNIPTGSVPVLQDKTVNIIQNGTTSVGPDSGYDGLSNVEVTVDVPSSSQGFPPDWTQLGYEDTPDTIINGFNYAKQIKDNWNPNVTSLYNKFSKDTNLLVLPFVDTSKVTNFSGFCENARHLIYIPLIDTSQATTLQNAFNGVTIAEFPELDTSSCTNFGGAFSNNKALKHFKTINTAKGKAFTNMFKDSEQLQDVEVYDLSSATNLNGMFTNCSNLSNESLNNIMEMLIGATSYSGTKTLKNIGLSSSQATTCQSLSNWDAFVAAGWSTGY